LSRLAVRIVFATLVVFTAAWATLALHFQHRVGAVLWPPFAIACIIYAWRGKPKAVPVYAGAFALLIAWWLTIRPSNARDWADEVAQQVTSSQRGDIVTIANVRNFTWRQHTDYDARWEPRTYDLTQLATLDVVCSYWMGPSIAHTLVSFGFSDGRYLTFSIEIRKEKGEDFSALGGFFKSFETTLIAAEESDILKVRTNIRHEDMYVYRVLMPPAEIRALFEAYLAEGAHLHEQPEWYNTATANCTTIIYELAKRIHPGGLPLDYRILVSGYLPEYLYDIKALPQGYDFATLKQTGRASDRGRASTGDFSRDIRDGLITASRSL
jgi:hypothetical protein